eukprot:CAMPEP_0206237244 /NCGR_PEP_ID=MMETSP0047_2-20121206/14162_1 /ASSEMBLY_ACC=CAM_ASM_000192 /TAXON_ID=195065 /ORGANISM="Chroomonas mesostigmatica_cf, Strain CCMP1168" /LENGTH=73 /DNA_ID=CAMNT_0053661667 /DNA_START=458 /DNA_END=679 /DNA_ORIENTATION=-
MESKTPRGCEGADRRQGGRERQEGVIGKVIMWALMGGRSGSDAKKHTPIVSHNSCTKKVTRHQTTPLATNFEL